MREFFELVNEYPWTTFFLFLGICAVLESIGAMIHGPGYKITYKSDISDKSNKSDKSDKSDEEKNSGSQLRSTILLINFIINLSSNLRSNLRSYIYWTYW